MVSDPDPAVQPEREPKRHDSYHTWGVVTILVAATIVATTHPAY
jgi:hypothetical protein